MSKGIGTAPLRTDKELDEDIARTEARLRDEERRLPRVSNMAIDEIITLLAGGGIKAVRVF